MGTRAHEATSVIGRGWVGGAPSMAPPGSPSRDAWRRFAGGTLIQEAISLLGQGGRGGGGERGPAW